jgi:CRP/FNR family cyclic AMP-dependent transcriptional regulator
MADAADPLAQLPLLEGLDADEFLSITKRFNREQYPAGTKVLEEGYGGLKLYVLIEGRVKVFRNMGRSQLLITTLDPPETFGEISIIDGGPASATVEAETDVVVLTLMRDDFYDIAHGSWTIQAKLYKNLLHTMCQRIRATTNQVQDYFAINQALCENENFRKFYKLFIV